MNREVVGSGVGASGVVGKVQTSSFTVQLSTYIYLEADGPSGLAALVTSGAQTPSHAMQQTTPVNREIDGPIVGEGGTVRGVQTTSHTVQQSSSGKWWCRRCGSWNSNNFTYIAAVIASASRS